MALTPKEWAAEYRRINELEAAEKSEWLSRLTLEESVRLYQELCQMALASGSEGQTPEEEAALWEMRMSHYRDWEEKVRRIARRQGYALSI